jgi:ribonuclease Z
MHLTLLGTGCPSVDIERYGPSVLVRVGEEARMLVDCRSGATQRLLEASGPGRDIDAVVLTHLHSDHIFERWFPGRSPQIYQNLELHN